MFFNELQSLRGLAALTVFIVHCFDKINFSNSYLNTIHKYLQTGAFSSYILFFVLSAFVLTMSVSKAKVGSDVAKFIIKRFVRLVIPITAIIIITTIVYNLVSEMLNISFAIQQFDIFYNFGINNLLLNFFSFRNDLNLPTWTLKYELIFSILLPLSFVIVFLKTNHLNKLKYIIYILIIYYLFIEFDKFYLAFIVGISVYLIHYFLYKHLVINIKRSFLVFFINISVIFSLYLMLYLPHQIDDIGSEKLLLSAIGSGLLILCLIHKKTLVNYILNINAFQYLGKISFSLYLVHYPVLHFISTLMFYYYGLGNELTYIQTIQNNQQFYVFILITIPVVLICSHIFYKVVESKYTYKNLAIYLYK